MPHPEHVFDHQITQPTHEKDNRLPISPERPYFFGAQDAWWITTFAQKYDRLEPHSSEPVDTKHSRRMITPAVVFNHATAYGPEIIKTGVLASIFPYTQENGAITDVEPRGSFTPDWRVTATIITELLNVSRYQKGLDISDRTFQIFLLGHNGYKIAKIRDREEFVSTSPLIFNPESLAQNPEFAFFDPHQLYTGFPTKEFIMAVPATQRLADLALGLSTQIVFGMSEIEVARLIHNHFEMEYLINKDAFSFFNGHHDQDKFKTIGMLWAHSLMRHYWHSFIYPVEALIKTGYFDDTPEQAGYVYDYFRKQMISGALIADYEYRRQRLNREIGSKFTIPPTEAIDPQVAYMYMRNEFPRAAVLRHIHTYQPSGESFYRTSYERNGFPYIPAGLLAYWVDTRQVQIDPSTLGIAKNQMIQAPENEQILMRGNFMWRENGSLVSRFNPWRSSQYEWYRDNGYFIPETVSGV